MVEQLLSLHSYSSKQQDKHYNNKKEKRKEKREKEIQTAELPVKIWKEVKGRVLYPI